MVGFKAKAKASAYFTKMEWRRGCVFVSGVCVGCVCVGCVGVCVWGGGYICVYGWGGWGVLKGWEYIGKRGRREITSFCHVCYIKFISSWKKIPSH